MGIRDSKLFARFRGLRSVIRRNSLAKAGFIYFVEFGEIACCLRLKPVYNAVRFEFRTEV